MQAVPIHADPETRQHRKADQWSFQLRWSTVTGCGSAGFQRVVSLSLTWKLWCTEPGNFCRHCICSTTELQLSLWQWGSDTCMCFDIHFSIRDSPSPALICECTAAPFIEISKVAQACITSVVLNITVFTQPSAGVTSSIMDARRHPEKERRNRGSSFLNPITNIMN